MYLKYTAYSHTPFEDLHWLITTATGSYSLYFNVCDLNNSVKYKFLLALTHRDQLCTMNQINAYFEAHCDAHTVSLLFGCFMLHRSGKKKVIYKLIIS